ncbi:exosomal polycystin-1-interacting protein-like [Heterodontus francisci]|uniref:exosomal polycystin-1-interacting protein-like n=1 Tax=Heterodontus francisci TaxID=7792 RepID=UPI00355C0647
MKVTDAVSTQLVLYVLWCYVCVALVRSSNHTLIFQIESNFRNCSCFSSIPDCGFALANLACNCKTVSSEDMDKASPTFSFSGELVVWVSDTATVGLLLNYSSVPNLRLSLCSPDAVLTEYLIIFGLKKLCVTNPKANAYPLQNITIYSTGSAAVKSSLQNSTGFSFYISFLNMALLNGDSKLKAYSVPNVTNIAEYFPDLHYDTTSLPSEAKSSFVTFIYV